MNDHVVDEVRRVREELILLHGGLAGYLRFCEEQDRPRKRIAKRIRKRSQGKSAPGDIAKRRR